MKILLTPQVTDSRTAKDPNELTRATAIVTDWYHIAERATLLFRYEIKDVHKAVGSASAREDDRASTIARRSREVDCWGHERTLPWTHQRHASFSPAQNDDCKKKSIVKGYEIACRDTSPVREIVVLKMNGRLLTKATSR